MTLAELRRLAADIPPGPWRAYRSGYDGALLVEDVATEEPLVLVYYGRPLAAYLVACAPATLLGPPT